MIRVLHLDDEEADLELTEIKLLRLDSELEVQGVTTPREAMNLLQSQRFDCLVSDYQMPDMNGLEVLQSLRETGNSIPFIMFTGQGNEEVAAKVFHAGASDYFSKQMEFASFDRLINSIRRNVELHRTHRRRDLIDTALNMVINDTSAHVGPRFFEELLQSLVRELNMDSAFVGERTGPEEITTRAFLYKDTFLDPVSYNVDGTPCRHVLEDTYCMHPRNTYRDFPQDKFLCQHEIEGYIGSAIVNSQNETIGMLSVMKVEPVEEPEMVLDFLRVFTMRLGAELQRMEMLEELQNRESNYRSIFEDAMEAAAIIDVESATFLNVNRAFCELFGYSKQELIGKPPRFLSGAPDKHDAEQRRNLFASMAVGEKRTLKVFTRDAEGNTFWCRLSLRAFSADGKRCIMISPKRLEGDEFNPSESSDMDSDLLDQS